VLHQPCVSARFVLRRGAWGQVFGTGGFRCISTGLAPIQGNKRAIYWPFVKPSDGFETVDPLLTMRCDRQSVANPRQRSFACLSRIRGPSVRHRLRPRGFDEWPIERRHSLHNSVESGIPCGRPPAPAPDPRVLRLGVLWWDFGVHAFGCTRGPLTGLAPTTPTGSRGAMQPVARARVRRGPCSEPGVQRAR
jgi:hypothetical protein